MAKIVKKSGWRGMRKQGGIASVGEDQLYTITNGRWDGGGNITERGGQTKLLGSALSPALITGIYDSSIGGTLVGGTSGGGGGGGPVGTGGGGGGPTPPGSGDGPKIYWPGDSVYTLYFDEEKSNSTYTGNIFETNCTAALKGPVTGEALSFSHVAVQWNGQLWWIVNGLAGWGLASQDPAYGTNQPLPVIRSFTDATITSVKVGSGVWRGKLYASVSMVFADKPTTYEFDGVTLKVIDPAVASVTANVIGQPFGYQDRLYVAYNGSDNVIRNITIAGTGADSTMPSTKFQMGTAFGYSFAEYKGTLYVCGTDGDGTGATARGVIYSTTGTTFALARNLGTSPTANPVRCLQVFNGYLYYHWTDTANSSISRLGRFDGTTWTDNHFSFSAGPPVEGAFPQMFKYKGDLVVTSTDISPDVPAWRSAGTDTTTWTGMQINTASGRQRFPTRCTPFY